MQRADLIITGDNIYTGLTATTHPGFVAIKDNKILKVSKEIEELTDYIDDNTEVQDFKDELIMPAFFDGHTHLILAGMYKTFVNLGESKSEEEAAEMVSKFAETMEDAPWIIGFNWYHVFWENKVLPTKHSLDKYFPDRPVFLINAEAHGAWVNSKAMEICGIDKDTKDPNYGHIEKLENGEPSGFLFEAALGLIAVNALKFTVDQEKAFAQKYMESAAKFGITSVLDMQPYFGVNLGKNETYQVLEKEGKLNLRVHCAPDLLGDLNETLKCREKFASEKLKITHLKQFLDGVPTTYTALTIDEYSDKPGDTGTQLSDIDAIRAKVLEAHKLGFSVRLHACGDRAVRIALDCFEEAINKYGKNEARHGIEHIEGIHPDDIPRFKELGIIPSIQPEHLALTQKFSENPYLPRLGKEREKYLWAFKSLLNSAGVLSIGTDCPVVDNDPFLEIYRAVTRLHNDGKPEGGWNPQEKLTMAEALSAYTLGSSFGVGREKELGTLEEGKLADIVVLNQNLFTIDAEKIRETKVILTIMDGKMIYKA